MKKLIPALFVVSLLFFGFTFTTLKFLEKDTSKDLQTSLTKYEQGEFKTDKNFKKRARDKYGDLRLERDFREPKFIQRQVIIKENTLSPEEEIEDLVRNSLELRKKIGEISNDKNRIENENREIKKENQKLSQENEKISKENQRLSQENEKLKKENLHYKFVLDVEKIKNFKKVEIPKSEIDISTWKIYENAILNFEIKIPQKISQPKIFEKHILYSDEDFKNPDSFLGINVFDQKNLGLSNIGIYGENPDSKIVINGRVFVFLDNPLAHLDIITEENPVKIRIYTTRENNTYYTFGFIGGDTLTTENIAILKSFKPYKKINTLTEEVQYFMQREPRTSIIFNKKNELLNNPRFSIKNSKSETIQQDIKDFFEAINLKSFSDIESIMKSNILTENQCEDIMHFYKNFNKKNIQKVDCSSKSQRENLFIEFYQINDEYFYFGLSQWNVVLEGLFNVIFDVENKKILEEANIQKNRRANIYYFKDTLWFNQYSKIINSYNLKTKALENYQDLENNESGKWWILKKTPELIIKSIENGEIINLGKFNQEILDSHPKSISFFITNKDKSKFALIDNTINCDTMYDGCMLHLWYGDLKEDGLNNSKLFKVKSKYNDRGCMPGKENLVTFKENKIITWSGGCQRTLESSIFDTDKNKFLYKSNELN